MSTATKPKSKAKENGAAEVKRVSSPQVTAGECPRNPAHQNTEIYKTNGRRRNCTCNDCGATWVKVGPFADELREYAVSLSDSLRDAERQEIGGQTVIVMTDELAKQIQAELYRLATT